jgi:thiol-disulfide isomerase/thioredoxin
VLAGPGAETSVSAGVVVLVVVLALAAAIGLVWRQRNGRIRATEPQADGPMLTSEELRAPLGERATLVQFSTAFCAPCRATRRILAEVVEMVDGVAHVEIDAEARLDLVRSFDIRRTPTVLVLGPGGQITKRASGQPRKADVIAALGNVPARSNVYPSDRKTW